MGAVAPTCFSALSFGSTSWLVSMPTPSQQPHATHISIVFHSVCSHATLLSSSHSRSINPQQRHTESGTSLTRACDDFVYSCVSSQRASSMHRCCCFLLSRASVSKLEHRAPSSRLTTSVLLSVRPFPLVRSGCPGHYGQWLPNRPLKVSHVTLFTLIPSLCPWKCSLLSPASLRSLCVQNGMTRQKPDECCWWSAHRWRCMWTEAPSTRQMYCIQHLDKPLVGGRGA